MTTEVEAEGVAVRSAPDDAEPACVEAEPACKAGGPVGYAVGHVARLHRMAGGKVLRGLGLYPGQEFVMLHLWKSGPLRQSDLIKFADLDPSTVTKMLQRLEQAGHVRRRPDPADRRAVLVEATAQSCALRRAVEESLNTLEEQMLTGLDEDERTELLRLLKKAERNLCAQTGECEEQE
ncbi:MarR family winged helix-turn-helix transcriptional regulator [Streptomyces sp. NPDC047315]|uniref:MarR family winged helix-turn-helix transcriptional regulator n=1 Tax=Streptomyces sp. NPDC047315 TaxID=3155142 RepID=UPI0033F04B37